MSLNPDLLFHIKSLSRLIYYVTDEDDQAIINLRDHLKGQHEGRIWVFNPTFGLKAVDKYIADWESHEHAVQKELVNPNDALTHIYKEDPKDGINFYVFTDAERWMKEEHLVRRILNIAHQVNNDIRTVKILIFMGSSKAIPTALQRYFQVVHDKGPDKDDVLKILTEACEHLELEVPENGEEMFRGMTTFEMKAAISQSMIQTRGIDPAFVSKFRRYQFAKTDLVQLLDPSKFSFDQVGGVTRFKKWVQKTRHAWTPEGRAFGLKPPKGVLCVGVWGCGKSLATKAMGAAWNLPVVQVEMGRLRSSQVGGSEANIHRVLRLIESAAPCLVWIDEAEKGMAGLGSSNMTDGGVTSRVLGIFSTWLQETEAPVCVAMTANSIRTLPPEFVNRMDERFFFDLPSTDDRTDILKIHIEKSHQNPEDFQLVRLAECAKGMVGREIEQAIAAAMVESFDQGKPSLDEGILVDVLQRKPRILKTMQDEVEEVRQWVGYDAEANDGVRARYAADPDRDRGGLKLSSIG
jgi:AAA+ superfamily predicted ATPase